MADTRLMGIVNVTPDSFSDAGKHLDKDLATAAIRSMIVAGAKVIDIGAESTRPGAPPVSPQEEWRRLEPVLTQINALRKPDVAFSIDTRHAEIAEEALKLGVDWINDVTGFSSPAMVEAVKNRSCTLVLMHSLGVPPNKAITLPQGSDPVEILMAWAKERIHVLEQHGIARHRMVFDPGIGFGKTPVQSLAIVRDIKKFTVLGVRVLVGHSRKSFLAGLSPDREDATLAVSLYLASQGVDYLRVHDVARHAQMLGVMSAILHDDRPSQHRRTA